MIYRRATLLLGIVGSLLASGSIAVEGEHRKTSDQPDGRLYSLIFEDDMSKSGCSIASQTLQVTKVKRTNEGLVGFEGIDQKGQRGNVGFEPLSNGSLPNVSASWLPNFFKPGNSLLIRYQVCGSGAFQSLYSITWPASSQLAAKPPSQCPKGHVLAKVVGRSEATDTRGTSVTLKVVGVQNNERLLDGSFAKGYAPDENNRGVENRSVGDVFCFKRAGGI